jgi:hypothetical protein
MHTGDINIIDHIRYSRQFVIRRDNDNVLCASIGRSFNINPLREKVKVIVAQ